jgi:hypothetical protein
VVILVRDHRSVRSEDTIEIMTGEVAKVPITTTLTKKAGRLRVEGRRVPLLVHAAHEASLPRDFGRNAAEIGSGERGEPQTWLS